MTRDWESAFSFWARPPGKTEEQRSENAIGAIRNAVNGSSKLKQRSIKVCLCLAGDGNRSKELGLYNFLGYDITHAWPTSARDRRATNATS